MERRSNRNMEGENKRINNSEITSEQKKNINNNGN